MLNLSVVWHTDTSGQVSNAGEFLCLSRSSRRKGRGESLENGPKHCESLHTFSTGPQKFC